MNQNDPTDHALAAIASILDHPAENLSPRTESAAPPAADEPAHAAEPVEEPAPSIAPEPEAIDVDHYVKLGPGPLEAIRFRWAARRDDEGRYFVDETIGSNSRPLSSGPMPKDEVIGFIDARAREAQQRFDALKSQMTLRPHDADHDGYEAGES
ncbi:hypothetical protein [Rhodopseudomonas sp. P2A-2r]|uniref:hypothetical protein n=1 Tax=unclassified Rhodopseudomonas TaxID=2638247 RepID=UPI0022348D55|nr:hypothetical protein [Rhodopseudomonas sp. P2A-2r]UZE47028.1 hypothetical protein ONR75_18670 [Rhodopseudomonas sp. P2A-2r]